MTGKMPPGRPPRTAIHRDLQGAYEELNSRLGGLPSPSEAEDIWTGIEYEEAHNSTALEGNTLVLRQVEILLRDGRAVGNKILREYMEVKGYSTAARWVYEQAREPRGWHGGGLISLAEIRQIHATAIGPAWEVGPPEHATPEESPGNFRRHEIEPFSSGMRPPSYTEVPALIRDWTEDATAVSADVKPIGEALAQGHAAFERIHPFLDGNGRVGRLILNLMLIRLGYPPAIIYKADRNRYLRGLDRADAGDPGPLGELLARAVLDNYYRFVVPAVAGPARLVPLASLVRRDLTARALRAAAERGRLKAARGGDGLWRSSRRWVDEYVQSRHRRSQGHSAGSPTESAAVLPT